MIVNLNCSFRMVGNGANVVGKVPFKECSCGNEIRGECYRSSAGCRPRTPLFQIRLHRWYDEVSNIAFG
jgi:hypothetical protein